MIKLIGVSFDEDSLEMLEKASAMDGRTRANFIRYASVMYAQEVLNNGTRFDKY
jgi:uncharacterized protein (DUF1778 family)